jgi:hypothetical protein
MRMQRSTTEAAPHVCGTEEIHTGDRQVQSGDDAGLVVTVLPGIDPRRIVRRGVPGRSALPQHGREGPIVCGQLRLHLGIGELEPTGTRPRVLVRSHAITVLRMKG